MTPVKKIAMIWTAAVIFLLIFAFVYFVIPFFFRVPPSIHAGIAAGVVGVILRFWSSFKLE